MPEMLAQAAGVRGLCRRVARRASAWRSTRPVLVVSPSGLGARRARSRRGPRRMPAGRRCRRARIWPWPHRPRSGSSPRPSGHPLPANVPPAKVPVVAPASGGTGSGYDLGGLTPFAVFVAIFGSALRSTRSARGSLAAGAGTSRRPVRSRDAPPHQLHPRDRSGGFRVQSEALDAEGSRWQLAAGALFTSAASAAPVLYGATGVTALRHAARLEPLHDQPRHGRDDERRLDRQGHHRPRRRRHRRQALRRDRGRPARPARRASCSRSTRPPARARSSARSASTRSRTSRSARSASSTAGTRPATTSTASTRRPARSTKVGESGLGVTFGNGIVVRPQRRALGAARR